MSFYIIAVLLLIICSAFFSAAETGLTAVSRAKIHKLQISGNRRASMVSHLRSQKDILIGSILLGNNVVNILASALATTVAIRMYGESGVVYVTVIMTFLVLVFGEVGPKTYALYNSEKVSLATAPLLIPIVKLFAPLTKMVQFCVDIMMVAFRIKKVDDAPSLDELKGAIDLHHHSGQMIKREKDMMQSILDLSATTVEDVMVHRKSIFSVDISQPVSEIITKVLDSNYTRIPVYRDDADNVVGVLHVKSLLKALRSYDGDIDELDIMSMAAKPWFVPETNSLSNQLYQFREKQNHMALVVDEYGDIVGLVTLEDILEDIVGNIYDEHEKVRNGIRKLKSGAYRISGDMTIRDINRKLEWDLPDDDATTIAGLIIHNAGMIPELKQEFIFGGFKFKVEKKKKNQITSIIARKEKTE